MNRSDYYSVSELAGLGWTDGQIRKRHEYLGAPDTYIKEAGCPVCSELYLKPRVQNVRLPKKRPKYKLRAVLPF